MLRRFWKKSANDYQRVYNERMKAGDLSAVKDKDLNSILLLSERTLTRKEGLPGRPWFTHQLYAPGVYTGYAAAPVPSVQHAINQRNWKQADEQIKVVADTLEKLAADVDKARTTIESK